MPIYTYTCNKCKEKIDLYRSISERLSETPCEACEEGIMQYEISYEGGINMGSDGATSKITHLSNKKRK